MEYELLFFRQRRDGTKYVIRQLYPGPNFKTALARAKTWIGLGRIVDVQIPKDNS